MRLRRSLLVVLVVVASSNCDGDRHVTAPVTPAASGIPNSVGTQWVYSVLHLFYSSSRGYYGHYVDTHTVTIADTVRMAESGALATRWELRPGLLRQDSAEDWTVVRKRGEESKGTNESVAMYSSAGSVAPQREYHFPIAVGDAWHCNVCEPPDSALQVIAVAPVCTPAGCFDSVYALTRSTDYGDGWVQVNEWLKPGIGFVRYETRFAILEGVTMETMYETWQLLSYDIKP